MISTRIRKLLKNVEWVNFLFILVSTTVAITGSVWLAHRGGVPLESWVLFVVMMFLTGLGITMGYHRLFSHRSFQAHRSLRIILLLLGGAAFQGSVREWCCAHRKHHRFVDTDKDPYSAKKGFFWSHVGWVVTKSDQSDESNIPDLLKDKDILWQDKHYVSLAILVSFLLPMALGSLWGDPWGALILAGFVRVVVNHHFTFFINSWAHFFGGQNYSDETTARDNFVLALVTYGEGYHNFHHKFESDYRNGVRYYHFDLTKWTIYLCSMFGLASNLKRVRPYEIFQARLKMQELKVRKRLAYRHDMKEKIHDEWEHMVQTVRGRLENVSSRMYQLRMEYQKTKSMKIDSFKEKLAEIKLEMRHARYEMDEAMKLWNNLLTSKLAPLKS